MQKEQRINRTVAAMARRIVSRFRPEKVILFGSHATGRAGPDSDVDLLVVMPISATRALHELQIRQALRSYRIPKDIVVTTPDAFEWRKAVPGTVERSATRGGRVLYERP
jgi:predicted nucleotidyltransferase